MTKTPTLPKIRFRVWHLFLLMILVTDYATKKTYRDSLSRDVLVRSRQQLAENVIFSIPFLVYVSFEHTDSEEIWDDQGWHETTVLALGVFGNYMELARTQRVRSFGNL